VLWSLDGRKDVRRRDEEAIMAVNECANANPIYITTGIVVETKRAVGRLGGEDEEMFGGGGYGESSWIRLRTRLMRKICLG
jgi:hypothetical protein